MSPFRKLGAPGIQNTAEAPVGQSDQQLDTVYSKGGVPQHDKTGQTDSDQKQDFQLARGSVDG